MSWENKEIIIPAFTCNIIPVAIKEAGATPVFVDAEKNGINIDPDQIERAITDQTKAIYVIHTYGITANIKEICRIARHHGVLVIEDVAHALFSEYDGKQLGTYGDFAIFSFSKQMINFEGGAIGTNEATACEKIKTIRNRFRKNHEIKIHDFSYNFVRTLGAAWESTFSIWLLMILKILDFINKKLWEGEYGLSLDTRRFYMRKISMRLTFHQLNALKLTMRKRKNDQIYTKFVNKRSKKIKFPERLQSEDDDMPFYHVGEIINDPFLNFLSFRTWRNFNTMGLYPRADNLYANCRIFSKIVNLNK